MTLSERQELESPTAAMTSPGAKDILRYRPDIDGLRAVAALSVVAYHLGLPLHGGYVGVDIFFVISGYLIGSIILKQTQAGTFTFRGFYERRIRRIFPALFALLAATSVAAFYFLLPSEIVEFGRSLVAATLSVSNVYFWHTAGYFDLTSAEKPLLHTWSLGVEEQFYIALPVVLAGLRRWASRRIDLGVYLLTALSFLLSLWSMSHRATTAFYLAPQRAWELLCGTMLALDSMPKLRGRAAREAGALAGMVMMAAPIVLYKQWTAFPGVAALPVCVGTALVIAAGQHGETVVGRLLSLRPVVFLGLISYSVYLWHWPLIVFRQYGLTFISGLTRHQSELLELALTLIAGTVSWALVETPFRKGVLKLERRPLFVTAAAAVAATAALGVAMVQSGGVPGRFDRQTAEIASYMNGDPHDSRNQYRQGSCFVTDDTASLASYDAKTCLAEKPGEKQLLVLGDSHAAALWWGLSQTLPDVNVTQATASGCMPLLHQPPRQKEGCVAIMNFVLREYLPQHKVDAVVLHALWDSRNLESVGETLAWLKQHGVPVIVIGPAVQYDASEPRLLAQAILRKDAMLPRRHLLASKRELDAAMEREARDDWRVPYVSLWKLLCDGEACREFARADVPMQSDYGHVTKLGSVLAAERIESLGVLPLSLPSRPEAGGRGTQ